MFERKSRAFGFIFLFLSGILLSFTIGQLPVRPIVHTSAASNVTSVLRIDTVDKQPQIPGIYDSLGLAKKGLKRSVFESALQGLIELNKTGAINSTHILTICDLSQPSSSKRLFVIDLRKVQVLFNTYVAHGVNSGVNYARQFSNRPESLKSSLGFYLTSKTYTGENGYSLKLKGLERGFNDNAENRDIVMHGADYVSESSIRDKGYIGRSWGCPAVPVKISKPIIDRIKNGTCLFIYGDDKYYLAHSRFIGKKYSGSDVAACNSMTNSRMSSKF